MKSAYVAVCYVVVMLAICVILTFLLGGSFFHPEVMEIDEYE